MAWEDRPYYRERSEGGGGARSLRFLLPRTRLGIALILANVFIFLGQAFTAPVAAASPLVQWGRLTFQDGLAFTQPWRWITYQYLHGGGSHLFWNMLGLYFFLPVLEQMWGWRRTLAFYTVGGVAAAATFGLMSLVYPEAGIRGLIGASGSLLAIIGAIAVIAPDMQVLAMMVIPISMRVLAILYAVLYTLTILGDRNMSDAAHLGGLAFGAAFVFLGTRSRGVWEGQLQSFQRRRKQRQFDNERDAQKEIDRILQKVHDSGMNSLSRSERGALKRATERQRQADLARARRSR